MNKNKIGQERRKYPRLAGNIPVKIHSEDFDLVTETKNLSRTGAYCRVSKYIEPMTRLNVLLLIPQKRNKRVATKKISCHGVIVRTESVPGEDSFNIAVYFNDILTKDADCISDYINASLNSQALSSDA